MSYHTPEILAPAGNWDCVRAAVANGADAIYFGLDQFNARMRANNFRVDDLPSLMSFLHERGLRGYVTMNVLIFPNELDEACNYLDQLNAAGVDAVIVQDLGLAQLIRREQLSGRWSIKMHISTQMTVSSPEGVRWVDEQFDPAQIVLARELSLKDITACSEATSKPIEVFCHGALCVAYSGQCLTSESLGQRSANRGECAQACRLPYRLEVDGRVRESGERRYIVSPQDLCAIERVPQMLAAGVKSFKIEGRLKSPEYVAATTRAYRHALDAALGKHIQSSKEKEQELYAMQMTFSRGFYTGWLDGSNHPALTHGLFGKKRGVLVGRIADIGTENCIRLEQAPSIPIAPGDGFVIDAGQDRNQEQGGRIWDVDNDGRDLYFHGKGSHIDWDFVRPGQQLWKTADPALDKQLHASWSSFARQAAQKNTGGRLDIHFSGEEGEPLTATCRGISVISENILQRAEKRPLSPEVIEAQFSRLGDSDFSLGSCSYNLNEGLMLPVSQLNAMRRELVERVPADDGSVTTTPIEPLSIQYNWPEPQTVNPEDCKLYVLCREPEQALAAIKQTGVARIYLDFSDLSLLASTIKQLKALDEDVPVWVASLRIMKHKEGGLLRMAITSGADGILARNLGSLELLKDSKLPVAGDFSLNCANPQSASLLKAQGLASCCLSYDLNAQQVIDMLASGCGDFMELTIHQHIPLFHMEHCLFCTILSQGKNHKDCGRPCEYHKVRMHDRTGAFHRVLADEGCRNTVYNGQPQTAANYITPLRRRGLKQYRIELLDESPAEAAQIIELYRRLLSGQDSAEMIMDELQTIDRLGLCKDSLQGNTINL